MSFSFLLEERILEASLRFETFTITRFGPFLLLIQWQSSTVEGSTLTYSFSKFSKQCFPECYYHLFQEYQSIPGTHVWSITIAPALTL